LFRPFKPKTDRLALLAIKSQLQDPLGVTSSWNNSINLCHWTGVTCGHRHQRVTELDLESKNIRTGFFFFLCSLLTFGNLSFLRVINLGKQQFSRSNSQLKAGRLLGLETIVLSKQFFFRSSSLLRFQSSKTERLVVAQNNLTENLQALGLVGNNIRGIIPDSLGNLTLLNVLQLGFNKLQGSIPSSLGKCQNLMELSAPNNKLNGTLPPQIFGITTLSILLDLSENLLSGSIPLEGNSFNGSIPQSLNALKSIKELDLSCNNLSGQIPKYLEDLPFLEYLNLSYNHFEGEVPKKGVFSNETRISLIGNEQLCGGIGELHLPACHSGGPRKETNTILKVVIPVIGSVLIFLICSIVVYTRRTKLAHKSSSVLLMEQPFPIVSYAELTKATNEFSSSNIIGKGSFGFVYKGNLGEDGMSVAVKVMNLDKKGATKSFVAECEALRNIRHRNLIKIITICSSIDIKGADFKAIVYEYMQCGSLEDWLHPTNDEVGNLNLILRLNIVIEVACVIEYLHHHCQQPIVHGDLKPSNVLLDHDMVAHVSDFGLARFLLDHSFLIAPEGQSSSIGMKGTVGYIAPGDVYSFGILLLEMFTRRRPTDNMFNDGLTLHGYAKMALPKKVMGIVDPSLLMEARGPNRTRSHENEIIRIEECLVAVVRTGVACSMESPSERMQMTEVVTKLCAVRDIFIGNKV
ncbi:hypothetical protein CUMW_275020, partial [Citrus unshiu]